MLQKPKHFSSEYAEQFKDQSVVEAYRFRPSYPPEVFEVLAGLVQGEPRRVLDVGCGTGAIARYLVDHVDSLDAVDFSQHMIETGKQFPNGDDPRLRWLCGRVEDVSLDPPYSLITAGESLHWMDWNIVLPRFHQLLAPGAYLAVIESRTQPDPWTLLNEIILRYRTNKDKWQAYDMLEELEHHGLFQKVGEKITAPVPFPQSVDDYIESYHSRNGFSRERMDAVQAAAFDQEARETLLRTYSDSDGIMPLRVATSVVWGLPRG